MTLRDANMNRGDDDDVVEEDLDDFDAFCPVEMNATGCQRRDRVAARLLDPAATKAPRGARRAGGGRGMRCPSARRRGEKILLCRTAWAMSQTP